MLKDLELSDPYYIMHICENYHKIKNEVDSLSQQTARLVAVSKTKPIETLKEAYACGTRVFGENKVQEMTQKYEILPKDIEWHLIGHLQRNKVKYIAPFVHLIHAIDSFKLLQEVNKQALKNHRIIPCLLQIYIAQESTKFGLSESEAKEILHSNEFKTLQNIKIMGVMGMATHTTECHQIRAEFKKLKTIFETLRLEFPKTENLDLSEISMGMSNDYSIALEEGSTLVRIGSKIFGARH